MPSWNEIVTEGKHDTVRRKYLKLLHEETGRNVIIYYSGWLQKANLSVDVGINDADMTAFMSVIYRLDRTKGLDLILHTPGGELAATEAIIKYLMDMFDGDVRAVIPQLAMSAGTIVALSCKTILMGRGSNMGAIDPQMHNPLSGYFPADVLLKEFKKIQQELKTNPASASVWMPILQRIPPGLITQCEHAVKWSREMTKNFLKENMSADLKDTEKEQKSEEILTKLANTDNTMSHSRHIGLKEAISILGDKIEKLEDEQSLQDAVLSVHHASIITLSETATYKIIENHEGMASIYHANVAPMQMPSI